MHFTFVLAALATAAQVADGGTPITLDEALARAAEANAEVKLSRSEAERASVDAYASWAGVLPRLDLNATFGHDFVSGGSQAAIVPTAVDPVTHQFTLQPRAFAFPASDNADYSLGLTLQLPLFDGMRNWNTIRQANATQRAADHMLDENRLTVAFTTTQRFFEVLKAQESLRVLQETAARSEEIVRRAEALFEAGRGGRLDVLTARGNLGSDRIAIAQAESRLTQARAELAVVLGNGDSGEALRVIPPASVAVTGLTAAEEPPSQAELLDRARRARPLLMTRAQGLQAAELGQSMAHGAWWPVIGAQASYTRQSSTFSGNGGVYGDLNQSYTANAQIYLQWNLFNGRQTLADEQRAAIAAQRAQTQIEQAEAQVVAEITRARAILMAQQRTATIAAGNLATAELGVALARERLDAGVASQIEMRDASLKLTQSKLDLINARIDLVVARSDLNRAIGLGGTP